MPQRPALFAVVFLSVCMSANDLLADDLAAEKSHRDSVKQIDFFLRQGWDSESIEPASRCSDRESVRRVYLDLVGRIPTVFEVDTFLADGRDEKRRELVDVLLASEDYAQHFADLFDALLMGRSDEGHYQRRVTHGWRSYLEKVFRDNRPWDEVTREILLARPTEQDKRGAVWFLYERKNEHQSIAEAVAPAFFGVRIECAQCHDHMSADEIKQAHYWGLVALFNRGSNVDTKVGPRVAESAIGGFSEFANLSGASSPNLLSFLGSATVAEPRPEKDEKQEDAETFYERGSIDDEPRVPKVSRRAQFVEEVVRDHPLLARAMVNRLWAIMLGRGIVHPYDEMDSVHRPSHPELLGWLSADFVRSGYDIRSLIRNLALSEAYQLGSTRPDGVDDPATFAWYLERPLTAEQLARSIQLVARGNFQNDENLVKQFRQQLKEVLPDETVVGIDDALFYSNGRELDEFLNASAGEELIFEVLSKLDSNVDRVQLMFQRAFARDPSEEETTAVVAFMDQREDSRDAATRQVLWSLMTSAEFQFNH